MTINYLDSKRIQTSPNPSKSWEFADGKATGSFQLLPAGTSAFTLMVWVKFKDVSSNHEILRSGNANESIEIWTNTSGLYLSSSSWNGADSNTKLENASDLSTTAWTHIAICRDGSERDFIYINGEPASNFPSGRSKSVPTISDWHIGGRHDDTEDFDGDISQWLVYTDFKSQVEVQAVYNYGSGTLTPSTTNLQTHYNFAQTGSTLTDQQGSNNCTASGTIVTGKSGFGDVQAKPISKEVVLSRQGNDGGIGVRNFSGSGGGGSATAGFVNGGDGTANDITGASPTPYYAGGGGGGNGQNFNSGGTGGSSIGGNGGYNSVGANATANRGSGGGGGGNNASVGYAGGNGSDGVVIIRYATADGTATTSGSVTSDTSISGQTILTYTGTGTFQPASSSNVRYLVVGGGAGGGGDQAGGGGAGGYLSSSSYSVTVQSYSITVGSGGAGGSSGGSTPIAGGDSSFGTLTATGGGYGGTGSANASNGGSGGGMSADSASVTGLGTKVVTTTSVQDNSILVEKDTGRRYWFDTNAENRTITATGTYVYSQETGAFDNNKQGFHIATTSSALHGKTINSVSFWLAKIGSPTGTAYIRAYSNANLNGATTQVHEFGSIDVSTLTQGSSGMTSGWTKYTFNTGSHTLAQYDTVGLEWNGSGSSSTNVSMQGASSDQYDDTDTVRGRTTTSGTSPVATYDVKFEVTETTFWNMEPTFEDDFSSDNGTEVGSIYSVTGGKLTGTSNRSSGYKYWAVDLGTTLSNTAWVVDFDIDFTSISLSSGYGAYNAIQLTSSKGTDGIGISWLDQTSNSKFYVQKAGSNAPYFNTTISTTGGDGSGKYYVRLIRDGATFWARLYSNSARTNVIEQEEKSITSTGLQYFQINNFNSSPSTWNANISFEIDNLKIYNGVNTVN